MCLIQKIVGFFNAHFVSTVVSKRNDVVFRCKKRFYKNVKQIQGYSQGGLQCTSQVSKIMDSCGDLPALSKHWLSISGSSRAAS